MGPRVGTRECRSPTPGAKRADDPRETQVVSCDSCRTIAVDAWDAAGRKLGQGVTYVDPKIAPRPVSPAKELLARLRRILV